MRVPITGTSPNGNVAEPIKISAAVTINTMLIRSCLLYTSDAADERSSVDLGGRRIIKKKKCIHTSRADINTNKVTTSITSTRR